MALPRRVSATLFDKSIINVYDTATKQIVFIGDKYQVAKFLGIRDSSVNTYISTKCRCKKKYALRLAKENSTKNEQ